MGLIDDNFLNRHSSLLEIKKKESPGARKNNTSSKFKLKSLHPTKILEKSEAI